MALRRVQSEREEPVVSSGAPKWDRPGARRIRGSRAPGTSPVPTHVPAALSLSGGIGFLVSTLIFRGFYNASRKFAVAVLSAASSDPDRIASTFHIREGGNEDFNRVHRRLRHCRRGSVATDRRLR